MNRRGFTAIMDAMFFIVILTLAVSAISQMHEETPRDDSKLYEACDTLMHYRVYPSYLGYEKEDRPMLFSDLWALSVSASDGKGTDMAEEYLGLLFPQGDVGMKVEYEGRTECLNFCEDEWTQSVTRSYQVEFGGEITLTLNRR